MKKFYLLFLLITTSCMLSTSLQAQEYRSAIGLRLGSPVSASFKTFISNNGAIEGFVNYNTENTFSSYRWSRIGLGAAYQQHDDLGTSVNGLSWYYGFGATAYRWGYSDDSFFNDYGSFSLGIQGYLGLEYVFPSRKIVLSLDWVPTYFINGGYVSGFGYDQGALSVRYIFQQ